MNKEIERPVKLKTFYDDDGNYAEIPIMEIMERMTDDWIDDNITGENTSELRDCIKRFIDYSDHVEKNNRLLSKKIQSSRKHIEELTSILKDHKIECCETCNDYMLESENCKHDTEHGCTNWRLRGGE